MKRFRLIQAVLGSAALLWTSACVADSKTLWSIFWLSDRLPCQGYWTKPMTAADSMHCLPAGDVKVSICPRPEKYPDYPYDQGKPITIVGYQIVQILSVPTANGYMVVGSNNWIGGADIFAITGGVGTNKAAGNLPTNTSLLQGTEGHAKAHIDVYGVCDSGTQQALVNILYTSP
jgi:hypothetical protein